MVFARLSGFLFVIGIGVLIFGFSAARAGADGEALGEKERRDAAAVFDGGEAAEAKPAPAADDASEKPAGQITQPRLKLPDRPQRVTPKPTVADAQADAEAGDEKDEADAGDNQRNPRAVTPVFIVPPSYQPVPQNKWEYARLTSTLVLRNAVPAYSLELRSRNKKRVAGSWADLAKQLNGHRGDDQLAVLNALGDAGWELVALAADERADATVTTYLFKRQLQKKFR